MGGIIHAAKPPRASTSPRFPETKMRRLSYASDGSFNTLASPSSSSLSPLFVAICLPTTPRRLLFPCCESSAFWRHLQHIPLSPRRLFISPILPLSAALPRKSLPFVCVIYPPYQDTLHLHPSLSISQHPFLDKSSLQFFRYLPPSQGSLYPLSFSVTYRPATTR